MMKAGKQRDAAAPQPQQPVSSASAAAEESAAQLSGRERYVGARRRRETVVFSTTSIVLLVLLVVGALIGFGLLPVPFLNDFKTSTQAAGIGSIPCPPENAKPVKPSSISVRVINGADRDGLASNVADSLKESGVKVTWVGNATGDGYEGNIQISTGVQGVAAAYTVARFFTDPEIVLDARSDGSLDILLGKDFTKVVPAAELKTTLNKPLVPLPNCQPLTKD